MLCWNTENALARTTSDNLFLFVAKTAKWSSLLVFLLALKAAVALLSLDLPVWRRLSVKMGLVASVVLELWTAAEIHLAVLLLPVFKPTGLHLAVTRPAVQHCLCLLGQFGEFQGMLMWIWSPSYQCHGGEHYLTCLDQHDDSDITSSAGAYIWPLAVMLCSYS